MAGLEVLFASAAPAISCPQDALVCFLHWEVVTNGYYGLGTGDQVRCGAGLGGGESEARGLKALSDLAKQGPEASDAALLRAWRLCNSLHSVCLNPTTERCAGTAQQSLKQCCVASSFLKVLIHPISSEHLYRTIMAWNTQCYTPNSSNPPDTWVQTQMWREFWPTQPYSRLHHLA